MARQEVKEVICRHYEIISGCIGTCQECGQMREFDEDGRKPKLIKRGRLNGVLTMIIPPLIKEEQKMLTPEDKAKYGTLTIHGKGKWIHGHIDEIVQDIRTMGRKKLLQKWPFKMSALYTIMKEHTPELIGQAKGGWGDRSKPRIPKPAATVGTETSKKAVLSEHEQFLILTGYQMAVREILGADKKQM